MTSILTQQWLNMFQMSFLLFFSPRLVLHANYETYQKKHGSSITWASKMPLGFSLSRLQICFTTFLLTVFFVVYVNGFFFVLSIVLLPLGISSKVLLREKQSTITCVWLRDSFFLYTNSLPKARTYQASSLICDDIMLHILPAPVTRTLCTLRQHTLWFS